MAQVASSKLLTPQALQDSIYAFYYDLNENEKGSQIKGSPLNYFMGLLRRGPYSPPPNYESPQDRQLREYFEAKERLIAGRRERIERLKELEFEEWMQSLPLPEIKRLAPMGTTEITKRSQLRNHFDECIWESRRERLFSEAWSCRGCRP